ncbi:pimeloyl-ACP methyl ester carboxylesterase [Stella humosa]|uniref:Pimeloyl-ACP methyl ester carboxylesterase n=1 Tax=Stella humosa TaxID=94 RepID=A0A3N1M9L1_9PROT|nr:alpha/beta hydrolase [Stella humosa]ROQ00361.1 pimeloyl-ACP methyl ester carboxylesterase [Stella humosa]BBK30400.1 alpha/beta hydrolase [Stella humosa]
MGFATAGDGVRLYFEETGTGTPVIFVHEFGDNYRSWEPQVRRFARTRRCITFAARGYPPSDVPSDPEAYSQAIAASDIAAVLDAAGVERAHVVGCSMGGFAALHFGLDHADRALSIVAAGAGYGAEKQHEEYFRNISLTVARNFEEIGAERFAETYGSGASRVQFQNKNPRGWREFVERLAQHSAAGAAATMRGVQVRRPSLYDLADRFARMAAPTLVVVGDEDDHCIQPGVFLKKTIPACGLLILPKTGHAANQEEPELFNTVLGEFLDAVEAGRWTPRDPRARPDQIMRTAGS